MREKTHSTSYFGIGMGLFACCMATLAIIGGIKGYSSIPYWDMWDSTVNFNIRLAQGDYSVWWAQHNEHRIVLSKILFWMDQYFFGGLSTFLIITNYLLVLALVYLFWRIIQTF